jgi:DNA-binding PadR family transcriptional regulator
MSDWNAGEREFLIHLALNGPSDQTKVAEASRIVPATINLAKSRLIVRGYIEMAGTAQIGRGAPKKIYALTPAGVVAAVLEGELWDRLDEVLRYWDRVAPLPIKRYESLKEWGFERDVWEISRNVLVKYRPLIETLGRAADRLRYYMAGKDVVKFTAEKRVEGYRLMDPWRGLLWILDRDFYTEMYKMHWEARPMQYLEMVKGDPALREGWLRWFEGEEERFRKLKEQRKIILGDESVDD